MTLMAAATTAFVQALSAPSAVAPQVARVRLRPLSASATTAVVVRPLEAEAAERQLSAQPISWACRMAVECYAKTTTSTAPDAALDGLLAVVYARLMADPTLGGSVSLIDPVALTYDFDVDGEQTACGTFVFAVRQVAAPSVF